MAVETTVTTITIELLNGGVNFIPTQVTSSTVGELRAELGLTGEIAISQDSGANVMASDVTDDNEPKNISDENQDSNNKE